MDIALTNLSFSINEKVGMLTLKGPKGNQMTNNLINDLIEVFSEYVFPSDIHGLIIKGHGRHFSSGADVDELIDKVIDNSIIEGGKVLSYPNWFIKNKSIFCGINKMKIPVITAVKGFCIGSGLELALSGHIRICAEGSIIGFPESTFGLLPGATGTYRAFEILGLGNAVTMVLDGQLISSELAIEKGLFHKSCPKKEVFNYCEDLMDFILEKDELYNLEKVGEYLIEFDTLGRVNGN
ncbi:MAG TPA: enoyl-CoA hydratase/isomerase family protein [Tissierellales bacterium]|nr:enoyl-CoA hydratase/isomerase family protein [Tissierellales bacterium]